MHYHMVRGRQKSSLPYVLLRRENLADIQIKGNFQTVDLFQKSLELNSGQKNPAEYWTAPTLERVSSCKLYLVSTLC